MQIQTGLNKTSTENANILIHVYNDVIQSACDKLTSTHNLELKCSYTLYRVFIIEDSKLSKKSRISFYTKTVLSKYLTNHENKGLCTNLFKMSLNFVYSLVFFFTYVGFVGLSDIMPCRLVIRGLPLMTDSGSFSAFFNFILARSIFSRHTFLDTLIVSILYFGFSRRLLSHSVKVTQFRHTV